MGLVLVGAPAAPPIAPEGNAYLHLELFFAASAADLLAVLVLPPHELPVVVLRGERRAAAGRHGQVAGAANVVSRLAAAQRPSEPSRQSPTRRRRVPDGA